MFRYNNRCNKILNLVNKKCQNSEEEFDSKNISDNNKENSNCPVSKIPVSRSSSPLPSGAEDIDSQLKDVWQEVFPDQNNTSCNLISHELEKSHDENNFDSPPLTPFNLEAPTSFEASPMVEIQEIINDSTASLNNEFNILLPTPMPSPVNKHTSCLSDFCPQHDDRLVNPTPSHLIDSTPSSQQKTELTTTKKRTKRKSEWSSVKRKYLKNLGKSYVNKNGVMEDEKTMRSPCKCRYQCSNKLSHQQRIHCFSKFWKLGDTAKQWEYIVRYTEKLKKKRCLNQEIPNNRKFTFKYYLPLKTESTDTQYERIEVCQTMFLNTLSVTKRTLRTSWEKYDGSANIEADQRGRHKNHRVVINEAMVKSVCDHIKSFAPIELHYIRKDSTKLYLSGDLCIAKMHKLYLEWYDSTKYNNKALKQRQYRDIASSNFNLGFHVPKKDQCDDCHVFREKESPTEEERDKFMRHDENKKVARQLKHKDKEDAIGSAGTILTAVFDFQKVLTCPHGNINIFYYKRKLSCFNFTVFDMGKKKGFCYMWDESIGKRGANEVSSCLFHFIEQNAKKGIKEFRFWSDNCAGQNRNRIVYSLYVYAAQKFNVSIYHRFLEKGHTQNEGDSIHSVIERASKSKIIYTPEEWRLLARWAKNEEPYEVCNMTEFFDFKGQVNNKVWQKKYSGR